MILVIAFVFAVAVFVRVLPHRFAPEGAGVDHWFWRSYVEAYRRTRRFPPDLPQYLLDEAQWYPPVFPLVLSWLPAAALDRGSHYVALIADLGRLALLLVVTDYLTGSNPAALLISGLAYATTPIQVFYNIQLNPRVIAAFMLDVLLLLLSWYLQQPDWRVWLAMLGIGALVLLTHKMTTQLLWFVVTITALVYRNAAVGWLVPATVVAAMVLSGGFYWKVLRAHWDIVRFWNLHWRWIGADQLRESPIYGEPGYERGTKLHKRGLRGVAWHAFILFGFNPAVWISCLLVFERVFRASSFLIYPTPLLLWVLLPCLFAVLTALVPPLKCLGAGYLYVYNTSLFGSVVLALAFTYSRLPAISTPFVMLALAANVAGLCVYYTNFRRNNRSRVDPMLSRMLEELRPRPRGVVMCVPAHWHEVVAYRTGHPVLWGGHGFGFRRLEPVWPRLMVPIDVVIRRYGVQYLLTTDGALTRSCELDLPPATLVQHGDHRLYCFAADTVAPADSPVRDGYSAVQS